MICAANSSSIVLGGQFHKLLLFQLRLQSHSVFPLHILGLWLSQPLLAVALVGVGSNCNMVVILCEFLVGKDCLCSRLLAIKLINELGKTSKKINLFPADHLYFLRFA